ncbi:MAG: hypothetical protein IT180_10840 [Acidobacteria bacterium]|nr:hypothetical protein [Acidobacteriota bacterium]
MTPRRTEHRIAGFGGDAVPRSDVVPRARWLFLEAVRRTVPEAMQALGEIAPQVPETGPSSVLDAWCERWGFIAPERPSGPDWLKTVARRTAHYLRTRHPDEPAAWVFATSYRPPEFPALHVTWNPIEEPEQMFRARVESYIATVRATPGLARAPVKRVGPGETLDRDFEWTALYQVGRLTYLAIAERAGLDDPDPVRMAVASTAAVLGLRLRGRKRKQNLRS